jgi:hypothetical protein
VLLGLYYLTTIVVSQLKKQPGPEGLFKPIYILDPPYPAWTKWYDKLKEFKSCHGNLGVPSDNPLFRWMGDQWIPVGNQRFLYQDHERFACFFGREEAAAR